MTFSSIPFLRGIAFCAILSCSAAAFAQVDRRTLPKPLADHPGNVFLAGEDVAVTLPPAMADGWHVVDYEGKIVAEGRGTNSLGRLPVGYYEVQRTVAAATATERVSIGVLAPLAAQTPKTSPIAIDVAMAWSYKPDQMPAVANLCTMAGVNWVRDRLHWAEMEPNRGVLASETRYDVSALSQVAAGLQVLQVNHTSPAWANPAHSRFPLDLRDAHRFYREMARRWQGKVLAFEPWNEADIIEFGGHTGSEIATLQKASYLGLKAGNPQVIACQNVFASHSKPILADFHANQAWPYFDTFNLHHYSPLREYPSLYADFRAVSAGRSLWVTECNVPVSWSGDAKRQEASDGDLRVQAERVAKIYAASLHEGAAATFYFMLPHYVEQQTQFGIIHRDLTPRPAYVALAAVGRLLADAKPLGKLKSDNRSVRGFLFRARPDGKEQLVLVAWNDKDRSRLSLPAQPAAAFDHLGRARTATVGTVELSAAPVYLAFSGDSLGKFALEPPPSPAPWLEGKPSPVVLQAVWPQRRVSLGLSAYRVSRNKPEQIPLFVYNFGSEPVEGRLSVVGPQGWKLSLPSQVKATPGARVELALEVDSQAAAPDCATVTIRGDFPTAGPAVLSIRLLPKE